MRGRGAVFGFLVLLNGLVFAALRRAAAQGISAACPHRAGRWVGLLILLLNIPLLAFPIPPAETMRR